MAKEKNGTKVVVLVLVGLIGGGLIALDQGLLKTTDSISFDSGRQTSDLAPSGFDASSLPDNATFIPSDNPNEKSRVIQRMPEPSRIKPARTLTDIVSDYVDASPDKEAAIDSLSYTMALPKVTKEFQLAKAHAEIAKLQFERREWELKYQKLNEKGLDGYEGTEINEVNSSTFTSPVPSGAVGQRTLSTGTSGSDNDKKKEVTKSDFQLMGVSDLGDGDLVAKIVVNGKDFDVSDGDKMLGKFYFSIPSVFEVMVCDDDGCEEVR